MPELPEVEILVRHLAPLIKRKTIRGVDVRRRRVIAPTDEDEFSKTLTGAAFESVERRGKFLKFTMSHGRKAKTFTLLGHLGMSGRMYLLPGAESLPKHAAVVFHLGSENFVFEDTRYFGRLTLDLTGLRNLGPEPLGDAFTTEYLSAALKRSSQPIKVRLLDQSMVAGIGNIYASDALFRAGISPKRKSNRLPPRQVGDLVKSIRDVLAMAINDASRLSLDFTGREGRDKLFYHGSTAETGDHEERLMVYGREGKPCVKCGTAIRRIIQAARSTFHCPRCQK